MGLRHFWSRAALVAVLAAAAWAVGCEDRYEFDRPDYQRQSLGQELFEIWRGDAARSPTDAEARTEMLDREHAAFVRGVDAMAPAAQLETIDLYLRNARRPIDTGLLPSFSRKLEGSLERAVSHDGLAEGLGGDRRLAVEQYLGPGNRPALFRHLLGYEDLRPALLELGDTLLANDGVDAEGNAADAEGTAFYDLQHAIADGFREGLPAEGPPDETSSMALREILLVEDDRVRPADGRTSIPAVRFDERGLPLVRANADGEPVYPFVDRDGDDLADVDERDRFVFEGSQAPRRVQPFALDGGDDAFGRDDRGRATLSGQPLFEYIDLVDTGAHFLVRRIGDLHERGVVWDLADGLPTLLGERTSLDDAYGSYRGYPEDHPLADALDATVRTLAIDDLPEAARALAEFLDSSRLEFGRLFAAIEEAKTTIDAHPDAELADDSTIGYDLLPLVEQIADNPELWADLMVGLREPVTAELGEPFATTLRYSDPTTVPDGMGGYEACFQDCKSQYESEASERHPHGIGTVGRFECIRDCPDDELFSERTDFEARESPDNRSINAQIFHLLRDTAGVEYRMRITEANVDQVNISELPPLVILPGAAEAFIATIAGNLRIEDYVSDDFREGSPLGNLLSLVGIDPGNLSELMSTMTPLFGAELDPAPTPDQITRLFNQPDLGFTESGIEVDVNEPVCKDGYVMANHHADKLFAAEASGLIDAIQPIAKAFSDHDREDLLAELFVVVHRHYSARQNLYRQKDGAPSPMKGADFASFEPALLQLAESGRVFEALQQFAVAVDRAEPVDGVPFSEYLRRLVHRAVDRDGDFEPRHVEAPLELPDGQQIDEPSRMHVVLHAFGRISEELDDQPEVREQLGDALGGLGQAFGATREEEGEFVPEQPGTLAAASLLFREFASSAEEWRAEGTLDQKIIESWPEAASEAVHSRAFSAGVDLLETVADSESTRSATDGLLSHLVATGAGRDQVATALYQILLRRVDPAHWAPLADYLGEVLSPTVEWESAARPGLPFLSHALTFAHRMLTPEDGQAGIDLLYRGTGQIEGGEVALGAVSDTLLNYYRTDPASTDDFTAEDYRSSLRGLADWLGDEAHGLEQVYDLLRRSGGETQ